MITPDGRPFLPPMEFAKKVIEKNKRDPAPFGEVFFLRRTGRTTSMIVNALNQAKVGYKVIIKIALFSHSKHITRELEHYADQMGVTFSQMSNIKLVTSERDLVGRDFDVVFVDNAVYDIAIQTNPNPKFPKGISI
jgi:hypothetical protein